MKKFVVLFLILMTFVVVAQEDNKKKRPSWSQGLPERQAVPQPGKPAVNVDRPVESEIDAKPEIEPIKSGLELELVTEPIVVPQPVIEPVSTQPEVPNVTSRREAFEQYYGGKENSDISQQQALIKQYKWSIVKTLPIDIPNDYTGSDSLKLHIQINPKGRVVRVTRADNSIPEYVVESAEKSIRSWRFEPPEDLGIEEVIGKTFTIDVVTDA